ncbi:MAG: Rpn family recombination-promoting nuclease/putative transposase [Prevotella sp.]|nr:Rpn family recombination-promoting nuclease/putative transposase [Prevotella sp.]
MLYTEERYLNPYTDFGFKKLFGTPLNKDLLISFLNALLDGKEVVSDLTYLNGEQLGAGIEDRRAIFDVYCENEKGEKFIVEMQKAEQQYFKDRSVFYASFPIQEQGKRGNGWDFELKGVYTVGILNFVFPDDEYSEDCYHHEIKLMDTEDKHVFYDKLTFIYLEMPKFNKTEAQLETMMDKWLFVLRNLSRLMERPAALQERVFKRLFEQAEIGRFTQEERRGYEDSVKVYRDLINVMNTATRKGITQGREEGREQGLKEGLKEGLKMGREAVSHEIAERMKLQGFRSDDIRRLTGLPIEEVEQL